MEWINTDDELPEECTAVLVYAPSYEHLRNEQRYFSRHEVQELLSKVYDMGFKCAVAYNDNYVHFQGEQRLRVMRKDFEREGILFDPV